MRKAEEFKSKELKKILVIDLAFIGDVILATPVIRALKEQFPEAEISLLTVPLTKSVAELNPYVSQVLTYDKRGKERGITGMWQVAKKIKREKHIKMGK